MDFAWVPKTLYKQYSDISEANIVVLETPKRRVMGASHINYSLWAKDKTDDFDDRYWGSLLQTLKFNLTQKKLDKVLILGLAGGTMAYLIDKYFHPDRIDGVEIDPVVIEAGKKYFYLESLPFLRVIEADAVVWLDQAVKKEKQEKYDLIVLDIFHQEFTPTDCDTKEFYQKTSQLLKDDGSLILNKIYQSKLWKKQSQLFIDEKLDPFFIEVKVEQQKRPLHLDNALFYAHGIKK